MLSQEHPSSEMLSQERALGVFHGHWCLTREWAGRCLQLVMGQDFLRMMLWMGIALLTLVLYDWLIRWFLQWMLVLLLKNWIFQTAIGQDPWIIHTFRFLEIFVQYTQDLLGMLRFHMTRKPRRTKSCAS